MKKLIKLFDKAGNELVPDTINKLGGTVLNMIYNANSNNFYTSRFVKFIENGFGLYNANDSSNQIANGRCVPLYIIGYKKSIFE